MRMAVRLSRRKLLAGLALAPLGAASYVYGHEAIGATEGAVEAAQAWDAASADNEQFLEQQSDVFQNVVLGCSFAPEQWDVQPQAASGSIDGLRFCVEDLGLKEVRLPVRWDRVAADDGSID